VDIVGLVENMSYFICPHCHQEIDIFSKGGGERTAQQFALNFLGHIELDPDIRRAGDTGNPVAAAGEDSPHAKSFYQFSRNVVERVNELKASGSESVIQIR
jgi:ATP-binding protein involved in chromosome partitioning